MTDTAINKNICEQLLAAGLGPEAVAEELQNKGMTAGLIRLYQEEIRRMRIKKRQFNGFICMAAGAFTGFLSCVLTIMHVLPEMHGFIFYGLTVIAVLLVVAGLYLVFE